MLTEAQVQALEKKKADDEVCGEIETHHPGYLGSQDTFYVGNVKGMRINEARGLSLNDVLAGRIPKKNIDKMLRAFNIDTKAYI